MAVAFLLEVAGATSEQYEATMRGIRRGDPYSPYPDGCIAHVAGPTKDGWRMVDVWESEEAAEKFYGMASYQTSVEENLPSLRAEAFPVHRLEAYRVLRHSE